MLNKKLSATNRFRTCLLALLAFMITLETQALDMREFLEANASKNQEEFIQKFPYAQFLKENGFGNYDSLQDYKSRLDKIGLSGDKFLYKLTQFFIDQNPINQQDLPSFIARFHLAQYFLKENASEDMIYEMISHMLMEDLSQQLNVSLKGKKLSKKSPELQTLVKNLAEHQFIVTVPMTNLEKLQYHVSQGNWMYILDRVCKEFFWGSYWLFGMTVGLVLIISSLYFQKFIRWMYRLPLVFQRNN